jgi:hypothetical protein
VCVAAAVSLLAACTRPAEREPQPPPALPRPALPTTEPVLTRADVLAAVGQAASAYAAGTTYPDAVTALAGRKFEVVAPFGCDGPATGEDLDGYTVSRDGRALTLQLRSVQWQSPFWLTALADSTPAEAAEGFWLRRPWLAGSNCPSKTPLVEGATSTPETVGLVRVFEAGGSRVSRRGERPYRITVRTEPETHLAVPGFRLVLEGRIAEADGRPIRCRSRSVDERPTCLVRVAFDRISFRSAAGETLAEWRE